MTTTTTSLSSSKQSSSSFKVLTYNCGLLRLRCCCLWTAFANPPYTDLRFEHLADCLLGMDADVIALQEIYEKGHFEELAESLADVYPYYCRETPRQLPHKFHNGLAIFSKHPILESGIVVHRDVPLLERTMGCKAFLHVTIDTPHGKMFVVNMHTTAGGGLDPERSNGMRERELDDALEVCQQALDNNVEKVFLLGDLNLGPEASAPNYEYILEKDYVDCVTEVADGNAFMTWDPVNPLNASGPHSYCPPQRCDHIFLHKGCTSISPQSAQMIFKDDVAQTRRGQHVTLSDHYGIVVDFSVDNNNSSTSPKNNDSDKAATTATNAVVEEV
eukprot:m.138932 g.138932  ORF g.138932 m.138932 type:complete len:331 (-) comp13162_c0_seq22:2762-3754(-)